MKKQLTGFLLCICLAILAGCSAREPDKLTLEKVRELSGKGEELTWSDFEQYEGIETGSGLYIMEYDIDRQYKLVIGGTSGGKPMYIRLVLVEDIDTYIDIRTEDLEEFIARTEGS